ncbi:MAG: hypothetical protein NT078_02240, partial [Candidatus Azambacteria bacterium]|nr:hypothetical protein [Candidatus Azambacteria bacterium]
NLLNIYSADRKTLFLIDPLAVYYTPLAATISNLKISSWLTENRLLYANDFEIYFFDLNSGEKTLITRISNAINSLYLHPSGNYLVFSTDQSINTIELDQREKRNITELAKFDKIVDLTMNQNGNILYFYAKIGNQEGIYKLEIQ